MKENVNFGEPENCSYSDETIRIISDEDSESVESDPFGSDSDLIAAIDPPPGDGHGGGKITDIGDNKV